MTPEEYKHLKAFHDLIDSSIRQLRNATSQATLASAAKDLEAEWTDVHAEFAEVLGGIRASAWNMPYMQTRKVADALVEHLDATLQSVKQQLRG